MRLLITGAGGQLGSDLAETARRGACDTIALSRASCDILDPVSVTAALDEYAPDALVNCAAWTDVDGAEANRDAAFALNAAGPALLATACAQRDVLLVHMSTDYVFDGTSEQPVDEAATPNPLSVYGASKLAGEQAVRLATDRHLIVRTSGLYGRDGPNFVVKVLRRAASGEGLRVVADQFTSPTWTGDLATAMLRLIDLEPLGTFHLSNSGSVSWHEFATAALALAGYSCAVEPIRTTDLVTAAVRPQRSVLANKAWRALGEPPLPNWHAALANYVEELQRRGQAGVRSFAG